MRKGSVAIIGCGWLGFPLALKLLSEGYTVYGTTTREEKLAKLEAIGVNASVMKLPLVDLMSSIEGPTSHTSSPLWEADQLVLNLPPNRKDPASAKTYPAAVMSALLSFRRNQSSGRIIFTSSIGVYGKDHGLAIDRDTRIPIEHPTERQASLILAESLVQTQSQRPHKILRLGGLYGDDRDPKKWFAGREIPRPNDPTNLVSRDRVLDELLGLLDEPFWSGNAVYNLTDDVHLSRREAYG